MSGKNLVRKEFLNDSTWTCPAGVKQVRALVFGQLSSQCTAGAGVGGQGAGVIAQGKIYDWGYNANGQNGVGNVTTISSPVLVAGAFQWNALGLGVDNLFGINISGEGYAWGLNANGQLGVGDVTPRSSPVILAGTLKWRSISGGASSVGIATTGAAYAWGLNTNGQLGLGDVTPRSSPVIVLGGLTWRQVVSARSNFMLGVATNGFAYAWGANASGQLGLGDTTPRSSPVIIAGGPSTWASVSGSAGGTGGPFAVGIAQDGTGYAWGNNTHGQLGDGTTVSKSSPVLIAGGLKWRLLRAGGDTVVGITVDGIAYAWGRNESGQIGDGTVVSKSSPVLIAGPNIFRQISVGIATGSNLGYMIGVNVKGELYGWGSNANGQLGLGDVTPRSSPVIVVGSQVWRSIDNALLAEQIVNVTPGSTYEITIFGTTTAFGPTSLFVDEYVSGSIPTRVVLEYQA